MLASSAPHSTSLHALHPPSRLRLKPFRFTLPLNRPQKSHSFRPVTHTRATAQSQDSVSFQLCAVWCRSALQVLSPSPHSAPSHSSGAHFLSHERGRWCEVPTLALWCGCSLSPLKALPFGAVLSSAVRRCAASFRAPTPSLCDSKGRGAASVDAACARACALMCGGW